jgi:hypothetical protein
MNRSVEDRLRLLEDNAAIERVIFGYCRAVDRSNLDAVAKSFHPDAQCNFGLYSGGVEGLVAWLRERHKNILNANHVVSNVLIEFSDADKALAESKLITCIRYTPLGSTLFAKSAGIDVPDGKSVDCITFGRYVDIVLRRNNEWRISRRIAVLDQYQVFTAPDNEMSAPGMIRPQRNRSDIIFELQRQLGIAIDAA